MTTDALTLTVTLPGETWQTIEEMAYCINGEPGRQGKSLEWLLEVLPKPRFGAPINSAGDRGPVDEDFPLYALRHVIESVIANQGTVGARIISKGLCPSCGLPQEHGFCPDHYCEGDSMPQAVDGAAIN